jgi:hypothetical protein
VTSIFQRALGADFDRLHPLLRERFGFASTDRRACVGTGVMAEIRRGPAVTWPFLRLGAARNILVPARGRDVPFTIENYAYVDSHGRETVTFVRTFELPPRRWRFDATMVYDDRRGVVVDYLGTHQHVAADLHLYVDGRGGLHIRSGFMRLRESRIDLALPELSTGVAAVHEWYDERAETFRIEVRVTHRWLGCLFGYRGTFGVRYVDTTVAPVPAAVKPYREEARY